MNFPFAPERASDFAVQVDAIFYALTALTVFFTVVVLGFLLFLCIRYRVGNNVNRVEDPHSKWHNILEIGWSLPPLFLGLVMFAWAAIPYTQMYKAKPDALQIWVIGKRWMWHLQHANGVRENNELHIPVGKPVQLTLISQDVIHGFFVPEFRIKRDALPGRYNTMWFTPTKTGKYRIYCTEYCGTGHSEMTGICYVMEQRDYQAWLANGGEKVAANKQTMEQLGESLYNQLACGTCHDKDGIGRGPSLVGIYGMKVKRRDGQIVQVDNNYLRDSILNPSEDIVDKYQQVMPSYKGQLTEAQVLQLIAYIRSLDDIPRPTTPATTGGTTTTPGSATTGAAGTMTSSVPKSARPASGAATANDRMVPGM